MANCLMNWMDQRLLRQQVSVCDCAMHMKADYVLEVDLALQSTQIGKDSCIVNQY